MPGYRIGSIMPVGRAEKHGKVTKYCSVPFALEQHGTVQQKLFGRWPCMQFQEWYSACSVGPENAAGKYTYSLLHCLFFSCPV
jgi:hypothetical protein